MKKVISLLLTFVLLSTLSIPVLGVDVSGGSSTTDTVLTQDGSQFSVTVPTSLPVVVDKDGLVTTATNLKITNNSYGPIKVSNISVKTLSGWSITDMSKDFSKEKIGLKEFALMLNNEEVNSDGSIPLSSVNWPSVVGGDSLNIDYDINVGVQKTSLIDEAISNVIFTVGWDVTDTPDAPDVPDVPEIPSTPDSKYVLATDGDFQESVSVANIYTYIGTDEYVEVPHVIKGKPVTSYYSMFSYTSVKGVKSTNTNITNMTGMFEGSTATSLDVSELDTSSVTDMSYMFRDSQANEITGLMNFNTSNVGNMFNMFNESQATSLDVSSFDTYNVGNMGYMFSGSQATVLDLSNFYLSSNLYMQSMLDDSKANLVYVSTQSDIERFKNSGGVPYTLTFTVKGSTPETPVDKYVLAQDSDFSGETDGQFRYIGTDKYVEVPHVIKGVPVTSYAFMFMGAWWVEGVKSTNKHVTNMSDMFSMTQTFDFPVDTTFFLDLSNLDTSNVTNMRAMFFENKVTTLDLRSFDTSNVTNMSFMFAYSAATTLDLSSFNTSNVTDMDMMFQNSSATTGYAKTQEDADRFNATNTDKPEALIFTVK